MAQGNTNIVKNTTTTADTATNVLAQRTVLARRALLGALRLTLAPRTSDCVAWRVAPLYAAKHSLGMANPANLMKDLDHVAKWPTAQLAAGSSEDVVRKTQKDIVIKKSNILNQGFNVRFGHRTHP